MFKQLLELTVAVVTPPLDLFGEARSMPEESAGTHAAECAGDYRGQQTLGLLLGLVAEFPTYRRQREPVQHSGRAARAEDQLRTPDAGQARLQHPYDVRTNLVEPGVEASPPLWRIDCGPGH